MGRGDAKYQGLCLPRSQVIALRQWKNGRRVRDADFFFSSISCAWFRCTLKLLKHFQYFTFRSKCRLPGWSQRRQCSNNLLLDRPVVVLICVHALPCWKSNRNYSINSHYARNKKILAARKMLLRHPNAKTGCRKPTKQIPLSWLQKKKKRKRKHGREDKKRGCRASNQPPWYLKMPPNPSCVQDGRRKSPWITTIRPAGDNRSGWMEIKVMAQGWPLFLSSQGWVTVSWEAAVFVVLQSGRIIITTNAVAGY